MNSMKIAARNPTDLSVRGIATFYIDFVYIVERFL